jgi:1-phosphofructokinase family hexose kinase
MPKIITLTLNPALDRTIQLDNFSLDKVHRPIKIIEDAGGKGFNVSKALSKLGQKSVCIGVLGGSIGRKIQDLLDLYPNLVGEYIWTDKENRICSDYNSTQGDFKVNEAGLELSTADQESVLSRVYKLVDEDQIWVLSGSLPQGMSAEFLLKIAGIIEQKNSKVIFDTSGKVLIDIVNNHKPYLIKPNKEECEEVLGTTINSIEDAKLCVQRLLDKGCQNVALSLGPKGLVFGSNQKLEGSVGKTTPKIIYFQAPDVIVKKTVGAGDGLLAGLVYALARDLDTLEVGTWGVSVGSLSTTFENVEYADLVTTQNLVDSILKK